MDFSVKTSQIESLRTDCLIVSIFEDKSLSETAQLLDNKTGCVNKLLALKDFKLKIGSIGWLAVDGEAGFKRLLLVCLGKSAEQTSTADIRIASKAIANCLKTKNIKNAVWSFDPLPGIQAKVVATLIAESFITALYHYQETKTQNISVQALTKLTLHGQQSFSKPWQQGLELGKNIGEGINTARHLGNLPGNYCTPTHLAQYAQQLADDQLSVKVLDDKQMKKLSMGALLSVAAGSEEPAKLIIMNYKGAAATAKPTVLVGKGITFDTGGISIKPGLGMDEMKFDMCGAASVMGVMASLKRMRAKVNVIGVIAAAENMPSGRATKPGDVVTSMSGQTIEVLNTDAEGRLVLCDTLTYVERFKPKVVIDMATLTGACVIALGNHASGLYANNQELASALLQAGEEAQDRAWQMPLWDEYQKALDSNFADIANVGGREAGSVTAACFLSRFASKYPWAHLDIAGTAWLSGGAKGATGRPVGLLLQYLLGIYSETK